MINFKLPTNETRAKMLGKEVSPQRHPSTELGTKKMNRIGYRKSFIHVVCVLIFSVSLCLSGDFFAQTKAPAIYIDKGACPFECCTYRRWVTVRDTIGYAEPNTRSKRVGEFRAGSRVRGLTGEVRTRPSAFRVTKVHGKFKPGDVLMVYTPLGEGFYKVWFKGKMRQVELDYVNGPYEQSIPRCEETPSCWGKLDKPLDSEWWVKVRSSEGWVGWSNQPDNFSNKDACG